MTTIIAAITQFKKNNKNNSNNKNNKNEKNNSKQEGQQKTATTASKKKNDASALGISPASQQRTTRRGEAKQNKSYSSTYQEFLA